jgi:hypothetical protein
MAIVFVADQLVDGVTGRVFGHVEFLVEGGRIVDMGARVQHPSGVDVIELHVSDSEEESSREAIVSGSASVA